MQRTLTREDAGCAATQAASAHAPAHPARRQPDSIEDPRGSVKRARRGSKKAKRAPEAKTERAAGTATARKGNAPV